MSMLLVYIVRGYSSVSIDSSLRMNYEVQQSESYRSLSACMQPINEEKF